MVQHSEVVMMCTSKITLLPLPVLIPTLVTPTNRRQIMFTEAQKLKLFWLEIITLYQQKSKYFICVNLRQYGITIVFETKQELLVIYSVRNIYENFVRIRTNKVSKEKNYLVLNLA